MDFLREEKVKKFEEFVDLRLKPDLVHAIAERYNEGMLHGFPPNGDQVIFVEFGSGQMDTFKDKVFEQQKVFSDLKKNIETLEKNRVTCLRTSVNLGSEVYMQADVPDTRHIFVDVGLGFHVEFTWTEALEFISVKEARLARQVEEYTDLVARIKAQIKLVCEGIRELLQIPAQ